MDKEQIVQELLDMELIDESVAAILLDRVHVSSIPDFQWDDTPKNGLLTYIDNHIRYRNLKKSMCGCTTCTCSLSKIEITKN